MKDISFENVSWIYQVSKPFIPELIGLMVLSVLSSGAGVYIAVLTKEIIDMAQSTNRLLDVMPLLSLIILIIIISTVVNAVQSIWSAQVLERFTISIRSKVFVGLVNSKWQSFIKFHSGDLLTRITSDINVVVSSMMSLFTDIISLIATFIGSFIVLFIFDKGLALFTLIIAPVTAILFKLLSRRIYNIVSKIQENESDIRAFIQECFSKITVVKSFQLEVDTYNKLNKLHTFRKTFVLQKNRISVLSSVILSLGYYTAYYAALAWGIKGIIEKTTSFGVFTAFLQLVNKVQAPIFGLAQLIPKLISSFASVNRIIEIEKMKQEDYNELGIVYNQHSRVSIHIQSLYFSYVMDFNENDLSNNEIIFSNANLTINPGEIVAVIGTSGEGKTTLIRLLLALIGPSEGGVTFIDESGNSFAATANTRSMITYVPQGNTIISGTISDNLLVGKSTATVEEQYEALRLASAFEFVSKMPNGIESKIGENGIGLSEGQAQRIALARAFLREKPILILDEATSALDAKTEAEILENVTNLKHNPTCLIITHREHVKNICSTVYKIVDGIIEKQ